MRTTGDAATLNHSFATENQERAKRYTKRQHKE
jgi:hypothetical protein